MFCGSITEILPREVPHLPQCSYGLVNRGIYMLHWLLVAPQALTSVLPVEDSSFNQEMQPFSRNHAHQSTSETIKQDCEGQKQSQLLSNTLPLWFWRWIKLAVHFRDQLLSILCCGTTWFENNFHHNDKENLCHFSCHFSIFLHFFWYISWLETDIVASSDSVSHLVYRVFRWYFLTTVSLFSSLRRSTSVATCSSIFCPLTF